MLRSKKFLITSLFAFVLCSFAVSSGFGEAQTSVVVSDSASIETATLSPAFIEWQKKINAESRRSVDEISVNNVSNVGKTLEESSPIPEYSKGYIPDPVDLSHLQNNPPKIVKPSLKTTKSTVGATATVETSFDLRNESRLPAVRNQNPYGTCWAHAALGAMESNYLTQKLTSLGDSPDLSELHMAWFVYKDPEAGSAFTMKSTSDFGVGVLGYGGSAGRSTAYLARMAGPVNESSMPYSIASQDKTKADELVAASVGKKGPSDSSYPQVLRLLERYDIADVVSIDKELKASVNTAQLELVKGLIKEYGAVQISYNAGKGATSPEGSTTAYFDNSKGTSTNHAVLLVGWDDDFSAENFGENKPTSNGAWLVRNSWGETWGENGYFYMSYEQYITGISVYVAGDYDSDLRYYGHDPLGRAGQFGWVQSDPQYAANVFMAGDNEQIDSVSFYTTNNNVTYDVYVCNDLGTELPSSPLSGDSEPVSVASGTEPYAGYHTIKVPSQITVEKGHYFSIIIKFRDYDPDYYYVFATECAVSEFTESAIVNAGESFFNAGVTVTYDNGTKEVVPPFGKHNMYWKDGTTFASARNACIKAFTLPLYNVSISESIVNGTITANPAKAIKGETITLNVTPDTGYSVKSVKYNDIEITPENGVYSFVMPAGDVTVTAEFEAENYDVSVKTESSITADKTTAQYGETVKLTVKTGYKVSSISVKNGNNDVAVTKNDDDTYTFTMPAGSITIECEVTAIQYTITYNLDGGTNNANNPATYTVKDKVTLEAPTKDGYTFMGWTGEGVTKPTIGLKIEANSTGNRTYTANWTKNSGKSQEDDPNKPTFKSHSLILDGEIGVNFYMNLPTLVGVNYEDHDKCYMEFDINGDKSNALKYKDPEISYTENGNTYYGLRCYLSSVQMADTITAVLHYGNGLTVSQDYSVQEYLDAILDGDFSNSAKDLMVAIQNYGYYAQQMLSKANNWTIGEAYTEIKRASQSDYNETEISRAKENTAQYAISRDVGSSQIQEVQYSLLLDSKTTINVYLEVKDGYTGTVTAKLDGGTSNVATKLSNSEYLVQIRDIPAHELATVHTIDVEAGGSFTVKVAALSYVNTILNSTAEKISGVDLKTMKNGVTALYEYYDAAMTYAGRK